MPSVLRTHRKILYFHLSPAAGAFCSKRTFDTYPYCQWYRIKSYAAHALQNLAIPTSAVGGASDLKEPLSHRNSDMCPLILRHRIVSVLQNRLITPFTCTQYDMFYRNISYESLLPTAPYSRIYSERDYREELFFIFETLYFFA